MRSNASIQANYLYPVHTLLGLSNMYPQILEWLQTDSAPVPRSFSPLSYSIYTSSWVHTHMLHDSNFNSYRLIFRGSLNNRNTGKPLSHFQFFIFIINTAINIFLLFGVIFRG